MKKDCTWWAGYWDCINMTESVFKDRGQYWAGFGRAYEEQERKTHISESLEVRPRDELRIPTIEDIKACLS